MIIDYSVSFQVLDQFVFRFNKEQPSMGTKVRQSMIATTKEIIKIYGVSLIKSDKVQPLDLHNLPSLRTNNMQLAKITQASGRTIQRHIDRLLESGILTKKVWHGSHSCYELFINPKILWISELERVKNSKKREQEEKKSDTDNQVFTNNKSTKCPHSYTYKTTYKRNNRIIAVDKLNDLWTGNLDQNSEKAEKTQRKDLLQNGTQMENVLEKQTEAEKKAEKTQRKNLFQNDAQRKDAWREQVAPKNDAAQGKHTSAEKIRAQQTGAVDNQHSDAARHAFLLQHADALWEFAKEKLYKNAWLTKKQCTIAKTLLYQWYEPVSDNRIEHVHQVYKDRILLVEKYIKKDPDKRFVTLPHLYFDPKNPNGFTGTKPWYETQKKHKASLKLQQIVRCQIQKFKRNEAKDTAEARPRLTVFRECEQRIGKLQIPSLLQQFYAEVLQPNAQI
ncbi:hypothetical protein [Aquimarina muelleri]|uniref:hypothetical protein n=1 Tax=Aquimarina muelleri TaxID=279356 RepID=UPI0003FF13AF|nr:hypothetical protein [Aquimarina muelleri]MCX2764532.1 hypothetical protein [Aquimarina muelleri]